MHQHDVKTVLNDIAARGYDLIVFIDDLDRCTAATAAEMFEAINLFLSGLNSDGLSARFVIGMDPSVIAAHLDHVYSGLNTAQVAQQGEDPSVGWTYLRKLVQLPVIVPRLSADAISAFIDTISGAPGSSGLTPTPAKHETAVASAEPPQLLQATNGQAPLERGAPAAPPVPATGGHQVPTQIIAWQTMEQHPQVRELMNERLRAQPDATVREAKRLINVWQLYSRILAIAHPLDASAEISRARTMVILAEIIIRWPALQRYLLRRVDGQTGLRKLVRCVGDKESWTAAARQLGIDVNHHHAALECFRMLLKQYDGNEIARLVGIVF